MRPSCNSLSHCRTQLTAGVDHAAAAPIIGRQLVSWAPGGGEQNHYRWQVAPARNYAESTDVRMLFSLDIDAADLEMQLAGSSRQQNKMTSLRQLVQTYWLQYF